jgi:hypothetical protein
MVVPNMDLDAAADRLAFSLDDAKAMAKRALHYHFAKLMDLAGI